MGAPSLSRSVLTLETPTGKAGTQVTPSGEAAQALPSQSCRQGAWGCRALTWQVFADDISGFDGTGHGRMDNFIKLQAQACKSEPRQFSLFTTLKVKHTREFHVAAAPLLFTNTPVLTQVP